MARLRLAASSSEDNPSWTKERFEAALGMYKEEFGHGVPTPLYAAQETLAEFDTLVNGKFNPPLKLDDDSLFGVGLYPLGGLGLWLHRDNTLAKGRIQVLRRFYMASNLNATELSDLYSVPVAFYLSGGWVVMEWMGRDGALTHRMRGPESKWATVKGMLVGCPGM